ncbi:MAG: helix-turn-helix transcriptional regulator [Acidimicrobiia bacterium]
MPERSFGRVVRYRRTKLGLSQAKLGQLVGRSPATVRSWESDKSIPRDSKVLATLAAILGVDERTMFNKAGVEPPAVVETSPTIEEALATLAPEGSEPLPAGAVAAFHELESDQEPAVEEEAKSASVLVESKVPPDMEGPEGLGPDLLIDLEPDAVAPPVEPRHLPAPVPVAPIVAPPPVPHPVTEPRGPYIYTVPAPPVTEPSYVEESSQKQLYRVRTLATVVGLVALVIALLWATTEGLDALGTWWDDFTGTLRL